MQHTLYFWPGMGSAIPESLFALAGIPVQMEQTFPFADDDEEHGKSRERLRAVNPLCQIPTIVTPDGTVMTESVAIAHYICETASNVQFAPLPGTPERPRFLRWLAFMGSSIYPTFVFSDQPKRWVSGEDAQKELRRSLDQFREDRWRQLEEEVSPAPFVFGPHPGALDIFIAVMTEWRPRRDWFNANCPKIANIASAVRTLPELEEVWRRNFET